MTIHVCTTPDKLYGRQLETLTAPDWSTIAWSSRPGDRRGASLLADALAATGVDWRLNPIRKLDIDDDRRHFIARAESAGTHTLILAYAHWSTPPARQLVIELASAINADLYLCCTDGEGTTMHNTGVLDDAARHGWPVYPADEFPFTPADQSHASGTRAQDVKEPIVPTVGFGLFRNWCRQLLTDDEFAAVDTWYQDAYQAAATIDPHQPVEVAALAVRELGDVGRAEAITRLRAMQAALFRRGVVWNLTVSALDAWRRHQHIPAATTRDFARLTALSHPRTAAVAVLATIGLMPSDMRALTPADVIGTAGTITEHLLAEALCPLDIYIRYTEGKLFAAVDPRVLSGDTKFLTSQFNFPLPNARGGSRAGRTHLDPNSLDLRAIGAAA